MTRNKNVSRGGDDRIRSFTFGNQHIRTRKKKETTLKQTEVNKIPEQTKEKEKKERVQNKMRRKEKTEAQRGRRRNKTDWKRARIVDLH